MAPTVPADPLLRRLHAGESELADAGFRWGDKGTHTSRTIMLEELRALLRHCRPDAPRDDYIRAIREDNCLGKRTASTQKLSAQRLSELYSLDEGVPLFRAMRRCWYLDSAGQPLLALLLALTRDPLLRLTSSPVLALHPGEELLRQRMDEEVDRAVGDRLSDSTRAKVVRNAASSWTQSGHLRGRAHKIRQMVSPTPATTAYALLLGHLAGGRGEGLLSTFWAHVLDAPSSELLRLAADARRMGLLNMAHAGGVVSIDPTPLLSDTNGRG